MLILIVIEMVFIFIVAVFIPGDYSPGSFTNIVFDYHRYFNFPLSDLLVSSTITYVFYHQACTLEKETQAEYERDYKL